MVQLQALKPWMLSTLGLMLVLLMSIYTADHSTSKPSQQGFQLEQYAPFARGSHSSTSQLNVSACNGMEGAVGGV